MDWFNLIAGGFIGWIIGAVCGTLLQPPAMRLKHRYAARAQSRVPLDPKRHRVIVAESIHMGGVVCEITDYKVDHGESGDDSKSFTIYVRPSDYAN